MLSVSYGDVIQPPANKPGRIFTLKTEILIFRQGKVPAPAAYSVGYTARVTGTGLKVAGTNSGVFLAPCDDEGVYQMDGSDWVSVCDSETLIDNTNTRLEFNIPADTTAGTYRLIVKTASGSGNRVNKTLRTGMMEEVITVTTA